MQFSEHWLRTFVDPDLDSPALSHLLTMAGLEVEQAEPAAPGFSGVVVAKILSADQHPNADRLRVCRVDVGAAEALQIVCGAPNAAAGMTVPCAMVGARLPGDFEIKAAKLRGVESAGMLCSARELGLSDENQGLLSLAENLVAGTDLRAALALDDTLFTIKLTPNRPDCLSLLGIGREVATLTSSALTEPAFVTVPLSTDQARPVLVDAPDACPRYCGRLIRGVDPTRETPEWIVQRLERCGVRSISLLVDVTNYVMLELGQPLHAFDNAKIDGAVRVRWAKEGESLALLNNQTVSLGSSNLLIADDAGPLALAGVMGGLASRVTDQTQDVFLESAFFAPEAIAGRARAFGLSSDAAHRFERGVDFELPRRAIERATELILASAGGDAGPVTEAVSASHLPERKPVVLRVARAEQVIGIEFGVDAIAAILGRLGMPITVEKDRVILTPASFRFDLQIEEDLVEEVARIHGYENIPEAAPLGRMAMLPLPETRRGLSLLRGRMAALDYQEVINYAFVEERWEQDFCGVSAPILLANPIASHLSAMRSSLLGGLIGTLASNQRRRSSRVRVFEIGRCFLRNPEATPVAGYEQPVRIAGLAWGPAEPEQWGLAIRKHDFYDIKADVMALIGTEVLEFAAAAHPALHPGRSAEIRQDGKSIGWIGELHPKWVQRYELGSAPVCFELDLDAVQKRVLPSFAAPSRYPSMVRDIALIVDAGITAGRMLEVLGSAADEIVQAIDIFDVYQGKGVDPERKSVAFRIRFQHTERTLEDREVDVAVEKLVGFARSRLGAELRS